MVSIFAGGSGSEREGKFIGRIKQTAEKGGNVLVIVPDQFSFEYDKKLYECMGAKLFNSIETAGFNRLAENIINEYGGKNGDSADENAKIIMMYKAVSRFKKSGVTHFYKKYLDKGDFITELIGLVGQLRESGITPEGLQLAAERLEGSVSLKLLDISAIFGYYLEELEKADLSDSLAESALAVELAAKHGYFKGRQVFVSAFNSFTYDQKRMIEQIVSQSEGLGISLLTDDVCTKSFHNHPFAITVKTQQQIKDIADMCGKKVERIFCGEQNFKSEAIGFIGRNLYNLSREKFSGSTEGVKLYGADDVYEETDFICAEICRLVREENYSYNDIIVTVRDFESCDTVFEGIFEKYDIPYFIDRQDSVSSSAIVHYLNALFRTVLTKTYKTANIMKLIKSPLFSILNYDITYLEDYCLVWNVDGDMWKEPFVAGSEGVLKKVNKLREDIITPLERFKTACVDATAKEICEALYVLLGDIQLSQQTYSVVKRAAGSSNDTEIELSRSLKQLWNMSLSAVKSIYECLGDEKISLRQFYELYRLMLSQMKASNPPQKLDCVRITNAARSRTDGVKVLFAAEVNDGIFPAAVSGGGLITEREKEILSKSADIVIEQNALNDFRNERLIAYSALTGASDRLYVIYSRSDLTGNEKRPSMLVREVSDMLGIKVENINSLPAEFFCTSYKSAYSKFIEHSRDRSVSSESIRRSLNTSVLYRNKLEELRKLNSKKNFSLSPDIAEKVFFKDSETYVSPTKLNTYFNCPFKYFCERGLSLHKARKLEIDNLNKGNIIHNLFEKLLKNPTGSTPSDIYRSEFTEMTDEEIKDFIHKEFQSYYNEKLWGDFGKTAEFAFALDRLEESAFYMVRFLQKELSGSKFRPALLEYEVETKPDSELLTVSLEKGYKIKIVGKIDRADIFEDGDGERYIRIIDYKTGSEDISLSALYNGLNLQMFLYLSHLIETKNVVNTDEQLKQAGVLYFNFKSYVKPVDDVEKSDEELYEGACKKIESCPEATGRVNDTEDILGAMKDTETASYTPYTDDQKGRESGVIISDGLFSALRKFSLIKTAEFGSRLMSGDIGASPLDSTCKYCDFAGICGMAKSKDDAYNSENKEDEKKMKEKLDEIMNGGEGK